MKEEINSFQADSIRKVIIIGAGIAGPAMAIQLIRIGMQVEIFEARNVNEMNQGVFLGITPNGINVLKNLVDLSLLKGEYTPGKMVFYNAKDQKIGELETKEQVARYGAETIQIKRANLGRILRDEVEKHGIKIQYGFRLSGLKETEDYVQASFINGKTAQADILIACDGAHSVCREWVFPDAPKPIYTEQLSTGAMVPATSISGDKEGIKMIFGKKAFFAYALSNTNEIWWFNNFYREKEPTREEILTTLQQEIKDHLLRIHKDDPQPIVDIISKTYEIFAYPVYEMPPLEKWHTKRISLIGDAAHATAPHIGQGASLALEDTVVLSNCIYKYSQLEKAFKTFQDLRKPRVEKLIKQARKVGNVKSKPNPVATFFRDLLLRYFIKFEKKKMDWVYRFEVPMNYYRKKVHTESG